jgi:carbamoyltransferase
MAYSILAINPGHNGSVALVVDGEIVFYSEEERFSRVKYDGNPFRGMIHVLQNHYVDELIIGGTVVKTHELPWSGEDAYTALARKFNPNIRVTNLAHLHHLGHATSTFYGSGFESAVAIVVDGCGSYHKELMVNSQQEVCGYETETIYHCSYPHEFNAVYKRYSDGHNQYYDNGLQEFDNSVTLTKSYEAVTQYLGFHAIEAGKTMGLAPYGQYDENIPKFFINGKGNKNLLIPNYPASAFIDQHRNPYLTTFVNPSEWHNEPSLVRDVDKNIAWHIQNETEEQMYALIQKAIDITGENNVVISGGFGLNCVANYKYLKKFPGVNFYIDPISHDGGTAIGLARYAWYNYSKEVEPKQLNTVYLGTLPDYDQLTALVQQNLIEVNNTNADEIADLIIDGNIVSLFQGRAEGGPRALGNRSILFDPRNPNGKDIVNQVKRREWFRPFAGSCLEEHANEWFDMAGLSSSPYMMYAVDVRPDKLDQVPAITHVDNTCRVQTVNQEQNQHYYELINKFYEKTGVPVLFNTSFNLAGDPLVETIIDAAITLLRSDIKYLYLPEISKLVTKKAQ